MAAMAATAELARTSTPDGSDQCVAVTEGDEALDISRAERLDLRGNLGGRCIDYDDAERAICTRCRRRS